MIIETGKTEIDPNKQKTIEDLKDGFKELERVITQLGIDIHNSDADIQRSACWIAGQLLMACNHFFSNLNKKMEEEAMTVEEEEH